MDKAKRKSALNKFIEKSYGFGSYTKNETARLKNKTIVSRMKKSEDGKREYWACKGCGSALVSDINGHRAEIRSGNGALVFVEFKEMVAYCNNDKCTNRWNVFHFDGEFDSLPDDEDTVSYGESLFIDMPLALTDKPAQDPDRLDFIRKKLLGL